tara:strand:+ start:2819 stop:3733 length:915 start_codon:yes stop_codon:yes gene_type:complete
MEKKIHMVVHENYKSVEDYLFSLQGVFFNKILTLKNDIEIISNLYNNGDYLIFICLSMDWDNFHPKQWLNSGRILFLNTEHLTNENRMNIIQKFIQLNIPILDFSSTNIEIINNYLRLNNTTYEYTPLLIPYQLNTKELEYITTKKQSYEYDIGIIAAIPKAIDDDIVSNRTIIWNKLIKGKWKCLNINGFGKERDEQIQKCKIILNIHHFESFKIFEEIRCIRLILGDKVVISDKSYLDHLIDVHDLVVWTKHDKMLQTIDEVLNNFNMYQTKLENTNKDYINKSRQRILEYSKNKILDSNKF